MAYYNRPSGYGRVPTLTPQARHTECAPSRCPECGGLECLCRPRFFAGQLLTDEDLNLLDRYIVGKNKLHNRYLHGWGVVCGLEVVCHPCNMVTVRAGYALGPCGEDIVVCGDQEVDVCALIKKCRDADRRRWECEPYGFTADDSNCRDVTEDWILTVRYDEKPSRGVTALRGGSGASCCTSCSCGGSSACGCGCHGKGASSSSSSGASKCGCGSSGRQHESGCGTAKQKSAPPQCEPTVTCEGYVFEVCKAPRRRLKDDDQKGSEIIRRVLQCLQEVEEGAPKRPAAGASRAQMYEWCCAVKEFLLDLLAAHPVYDCSLAERLARFVCPDPTWQLFPTDAAYAAAVTDAVRQQAAPIGAAYIQYCICTMLLPPCPEPVEDPRVPLAVVTVRKDNCRVVSVCNLSVRKQVMTFPTLGYYLSFFGLGDRLRKLFERMCCRPTKTPDTRPGTTLPPPPPPPPPGRGMVDATGAPDAADPQTPAGQPGVNPPPAQPGQPTEPGAQPGAKPSSSLRGSKFARSMSQAWANRKREIDGETLFLAAVGVRDEKGEPVLSEEEMKDPFTLVMLNTVLGPLLRSVPDDTPARVGSIFKGARDAAPGAPAEETSRLTAQLAELQETVKRQQAKIDELDGRLKSQK